MDIERWESDTRAHLAGLSPIECNRTLGAMLAYHVRPGPPTDMYYADRNRQRVMATAYAPAFEAAMQRLIAEFGPVEGVG